MDHRGKQPIDGGQRRARRYSDRSGERKKGDNCGRRPPGSHDELWVPQWELDFCRSASMPWGKLLEAQSFMRPCDNVLSWDDLEGREAFHNAKARYWAKINGFKSNIPFPDPYMYIDQVDHDEVADPNLREDVHRSISDSEEDYWKEEKASTRQDEGVIIWGDFFLTHHTVWEYSPDLPVIVTGWGDLPAKPTGPIVPTGWGDVEITGEDGNKIIPTGWGDAEDNADEGIHGNENNWGNATGGWGGGEIYWNSNQNWGGNKNRYRKGKQWRKNSDRRAFCSRVEGSTRYGTGWDVQRTIS